MIARERLACHELIVLEGLDLGVYQRPIYQRVDKQLKECWRQDIRENSCSLRRRSDCGGSTSIKMG